MKQKKYLFITIIIVFSIFLIEIGAKFIYQFQFKKELNKKELLQYFASTDSSTLNASKNTAIQDLIPHPYYGFSKNKDSNSNINDFGFHGQLADSINQNGRFEVLVCGGSVAAQLINDYGNDFKNSLSKALNVPKDSIQIFSAALGGFKQPQQLMALNFLLSKNVHFDCVINIDGFNELALSIGENMPSGLNISYPRLWSLLNSQSLSSENVELIYQIYQSEKKRKKVRSLAQMPPFKWSNFFLMTALILDKKYQPDVKQMEKIYANILNSGRSFAKHGPENISIEKQMAFPEIVRNWQLSSTLMNTICEGQKISFFHFLQPNQYDINSKNLSEEEKNNYYLNAENSPYRNAIENGYPLLKLALKSEKHFFDLSQIFKNESQSIYADNCCHYNKKGYEILADSIAFKMNQGGLKDY